ncbi:histidine kinase [Paenibacillus sepulcri]|uniref:histidine kinase n=1 Tax=Paenibacillus sepulcri TaxID=359917 RepID=A0ABS7C2R7_9BACL|nr:histidine kinase [Paenibacillus sepulcri]
MLNHHSQLTLKKRIVFIFAASTFIPFFCTAVISYNAINSILTSRLESGIESNLDQIVLSLENSIDNINHISQQLAYPGSIAVKLETYLDTGNPNIRRNLVDQIKQEINHATFTNPSIGLTMYYRENGQVLFENFPLKDSFDIGNLPALAKYYKITYFGPHISNQRFTNEYVLSATREVDIPGKESLYIYIESGYKLTQNILQADRSVKNTFNLIMDNNGKIGYSELESVFPVSSRFQGSMSGKQSGMIGDYYWFGKKSNQGWEFVTLIPVSEYNKEKQHWITQMVVLSLMFAIISLLIAWMLWKMVYKPLNRFSLEIRSMAHSDFDSRYDETRIPEFDFLLIQFQKMKKQIRELFVEVELKEKRRMDLEIEKLRYQINPHFLMNTLDTAHWLAVMNGQKEIDRLVLSLNKLLHYNLGKMGVVSTISQEIESLKNYLILQQIRYDFEFVVRIHVDDKILSEPVPRFILQPLVENALYHGIKDNGSILVEVRFDQGILISVFDNGIGLSQETIDKLLDRDCPAEEQLGMGIGINYVKRMVDSHYEGRARLDINSMPGEGTTVCLSLPVQKEEARND